MGNIFDRPPEPLPEADIPLRAQTAKRQLEVYYERFFHQNRLRAREMAKIDYRARCGEINEQTRMHLRREQFLREFEYVRRKRNPQSLADYRVVRKIGQGSYGEVFLVRERASKRLFAMKKLRKDEMIGRSQVKHVWLERFVLAAVGQHPHVVKMYASFQDDDCLYFIMEYLPGGDLLNMLIRHGRLCENWARFYIAELVVAINALHRTGIIHRDIKPDNVLFNARGHVCLSDFGLSKSLLSTMQTTPSGPKDSTGFIEHVRKGDFNLPFSQRMAAWKAVARHHIFSAVGTPSYIAPEVLNDTFYSEACDWWSVGAILYEMLIGVPPFLAESPSDTIQMIRNWREYFEFPDWPASVLSPEARDLISRLICDPSRRLGATAGLSEFKAHPFFRGVDWDNLSEMKAPFIPELNKDDDTRYFDDDIPGPIAMTTKTRINTPSIISASSSSNPGSSEAPGAARPPPQSQQQHSPAGPEAQAGLPTASDRRRRASNRNIASRNSDIEFIGFTYVPFGDDHRGDWQKNLRQPHSAPPRSCSAQPARGRSAMHLGSAAQAQQAIDNGLQQRSQSASAAAPTQRAMSTPRLTSAGRAAAALPPYPRGALESAAAPGATPAPAPIALERPPPTAADRERPVEELSPVAAAPKRKERSFEGSTVTVEDATSPPRAPPGEDPAAEFRAGDRVRDKENDTDSIVAGLGAVRVIERYPDPPPPDRTADPPEASDRALAPAPIADRRNASVPDFGAPVSEVGSTFTPEIATIPEPAGASEFELPPLLPAPAESGSDADDPAAEPAIVRTHAGAPAWNPLGGAAGTAEDEPLCPPLDKQTLEQRDIEVPSAREVATFVENAVEEMQEAANELTQTKGAGDIEGLVESARSQLNGTANELRRNLSGSGR